MIDSIKLLVRERNDRRPEALERGDLLAETSGEDVSIQDVKGWRLCRVSRAPEERQEEREG